MLALVCYTFLPYFEFSLTGGLTGWEFTAGHISHANGLLRVLEALLPFIASFAAIGFNCLKNRHWSILTIVAITTVILFYVYTSNLHEVALRHAPEVAPIDDLGEGFAIVGLGWGNRLSFGLFVAALVSAIVSLMPFSFNQVIERAVDDTIDRSLEQSRRHIRAIEEGFTGRRKRNAATPTPPPAQEPAPPAEEPRQDNEDPSRFMPPGNPE